MQSRGFEDQVLVRELSPRHFEAGLFAEVLPSACVATADFIYIQLFTLGDGQLTSATHCPSKYPLHINYDVPRSVREAIKFAVI